MRALDLLGRPWTIRVRPVEGEGERYFVAEVAEIPGVSGDGDSEVDARADAYAALRDTLEAMLESGEMIPAPASWTGQMEGQIVASLDASPPSVVPKQASDNTGTLHDVKPGDDGTVQLGQQAVLA